MSQKQTYVGVDFGTSNSAVAIAGHGRDDRARVLPIDPAHKTPELMRSVLFFAHGSRQALTGAAAIASYLADEEGRFLQSVKSFLPSRTFSRTLIGGRSYTLHELIAAILRPMRASIAEHSQGPLQQVVFGRPASFSADPACDARAEEILRQAAVHAGFPSPTFVIEPIAAALRYEETLDHDELVLVGDFGAGTSDFTLMRLGPSRAGLLQRKQDILASAGVYVGGDTFDAAIVEHALLQHFGQGARYRDFDGETELPGWIVRKMLRWHELSLLREPKMVEFLQRAQKTCTDARGLKQFLSLLEENLGYDLFLAVEACKKQLSEKDAATISFHRGDIDIEVAVTQAEFRQWMAPLLATLDETVTHVLNSANAQAPDAIFLTGGTSNIPAVRALFADRFGADKLRSGDAFTSVAAGLGRAAALLAA